MSRSTSHIITFANIKGGVGKTSSVVNIAYLLGTEFNKRVLVIDADDQGNATKALGVRESFDRDHESLWCALDQKRRYQEVLVNSPYENIWVIPSTKELKGAQLAFGQSARGIKLFKKMLQGVSKDFDFVLIDTKPQINILLQAALAASDFYMIPSFPEPDSYDGFIDLVAECEEIFEEENPNLRCLGVLLTCVKKIPAHDAYVKFIQKHLQKAHVPYFKPVIRASNAMATGGLQSCPAVALPGSYAIREDYLKVTKMMLRQVTKLPSGKGKRPDLELLGLDAGDNKLPSQDILKISDNIEPIAIR
ncbi:MAG: ParA family protein [Oligoflexus sp.]